MASAISYATDGQVEVYSGASRTVIATIPGTANQYLGYALAAGGDWNRDGISDWIASSGDSSGKGAVQIRSGADSSLLHEIWSVWDDLNQVHPHQFGWTVAGGDANGDGIGDAVVGAYFWHDADFEYEGAAYLYYGCPAFSQSYGTGWPGTLGTPVLAAGGDPVVGQPFLFTASSSLGASTSGLVLVGLDDANDVLPSGATLLVDPLIGVPVVVPPTGLSLTMRIPDDPAFYFLDLYLQVLELDAGATGHVSMTQGLQLRCGFDL